MDIFISNQTPASATSGELIGDFGADPQLGSDSATDEWVDLQALKRPLEQGVLGVSPQEAFPDLPVDMKRPQFYYLHVGAGP